MKESRSKCEATCRDWPVSFANTVDKLSMKLIECWYGDAFWHMTEMSKSKPFACRLFSTWAAESKSWNQREVLGYFPCFPDNSPKQVNLGCTYSGLGAH